MPSLPNLCFPRGQNAGLFVLVLLNLHPMQNFRHIEARRVILYHAFHAEFGSAGANGLFHQRNPGMGNAIGTAFIIGWDNFMFQYGIEREAICFGLRFCIVIFAFFTNGPPIFAIETLVPPAIKNAAIGLTVERGFLSAGAAGLVWSNGIIEPEVGAGYQVTRHINVVVFQENDLTAQSVSAREAIDLFDQALAGFIGRMRFTSKDDLYWTLW